MSSQLSKALREARGIAIAKATQGLVEKLIDKADEIAGRKPDDVETADVVDLVEIGLAIVHLRADQGLVDLFHRVTGRDEREVAEAIAAAVREAGENAG